MRYMTGVYRVWLQALFFTLVLVSAPATLLADTDEPQVPVPQVDINTADAETLALALDGVGVARAMEIVAWREENGPFTTVEQLQEVSGIGPATLERNRERIIVDSP
jgi:competence protein ComEA